MKRIFVSLVLLGLLGCSGQQAISSDFFKARRVGDYALHPIEGTLCGFVRGWHNDRAKEQCFCVQFVEGNDRSIEVALFAITDDVNCD